MEGKISVILPYRHPQAPPGTVGGWAGREGGLAHLKLCGAGAGGGWWGEESRQEAAVPLRPSQVASDFHKEHEGSGRLSAGAREAGGEGARSVSLGPRWEAEEKGPVLAAWPLGSRLALGSILFSGILVGTSCSQEQCLDFFLSSFFKKILIEGREGPEPLTEQLSIVEASGTMCP